MAQLVDRQACSKTSNSAAGGTATAVVLSGGGALGAFEIGVLEALVSGHWAGGRHGPVEPRVFVGTSVGAYNAAVLASHHGSVRRAVHDLCRIWLALIASRPGHRGHVFRIARPIEAILPVLYALDVLIGLMREVPFQSEPRLRRLVHRFLHTVPGELLTQRVKPVRYVDARPLDALIRRTVDVDRLAQAAARPLLVPTLDWLSGQVRIFHNRPDLDRHLGARHKAATPAMTPANTRRVLRASAAIPGIVRPVRVGDRLYADASEVVAIPVQAAADAGARVIHTVGTFPPVARIPVDAVPSILQVLERLIVTSPTDEFLEGLDLTYTLNEMHAAVRSAPSPEPADRPSDARSTTIRREFFDRPDVTVHRHFPTEQFAGLLSALDFDHDRLSAYMKKGFDAAVHHDCAQNGCLLPPRDAPHARPESRRSLPTPSAPTHSVASRPGASS